MGGSHSCFPSPLDKINTLRRHRHGQSKIQRYQINKNNNAININRASEDELMKLPGITRPLAQEILYHRQSKDGFKHVDELLQISGMQPTVFEQIQSDISVPSPPASRLDADHRSEPIHLNCATYDQLLTVPGLTPILVERIVQRRERKGPFRFVEDLLKVKGIDYIVLARLRTYVTVDDHRPMRVSVSESSLLQSNLNPIYPTLTRQTANATTDSLSMASLLLETLPPELQTILLLSPPQRPSTCTIDETKSVRFASWNLQQLTTEKVQNPGVREVICRIILEHQ